jgi:hypothetical protein
MLDTNSFIVRSSGRKSGHYYIDYIGHYKIADIAKEAKIDLPKLEQIYKESNPEYDSELDIYYFNDILKAKKTIADIISLMKTDNKGHLISLTETEIEYIRKALINESMGNIGIDSKLKDKIFKKLNI